MGRVELQAPRSLITGLRAQKPLQASSITSRMGRMCELQVVVMK